MHLKRSTIRTIINWSAILVILVFAFLLVTSGGSVIFMARFLAWGPSDAGDVQRFASKEIQNRPVTMPLDQDPVDSLDGPIEYLQDGKLVIADLDNLMEESRTSALIVLQDGVVRFERYYNRTSRETLNTSFSVAKSFDSVLVGIAIHEGYISNVNDPIVSYLPELRGRGLELVTIRDLLDMSTGIRYVEERAVWPFIWMSDDARTYYMPNLRALALEVVPSSEAPGEAFRYNNFHPLLEGLILERATKMPVAYYLQEKLWQPLGMQYPAGWSIDSKLSGFEKMESGINARSIDFARFGQLMLDNGYWQGMQLIPAEWVKESTTAGGYDERSWLTYAEFKDSGGYYRYHWWGRSRAEGHYEFMAIGHLGQFIYICPQTRVVIVRNGDGEGPVDDWPALLQALEDKLVAGGD